MPQFNTFQFNTGLLNGLSNSAEIFSEDLAVFNGFSLDDGVTFSVERILDSGPERDLIGQEIPNGDGEFLNNNFWRKAPIIIEGHILTSTKLELLNAMDTFRKNLAPAEQWLDLTEEGRVRRYLATLTGMRGVFPIREHYTSTHIRYKAEFECREAFAQDRDILAYDSLISSSPATHIIDNTGTYKTCPTFVIVFQAANNVSVLQIGNDENSGVIRVTPAGGFAAGDQLEIDCENKRVYHNSVRIDYEGTFFRLETGENTIRYTTTGTSFSYRATIKFRRRYF